MMNAIRSIGISTASLSGVTRESEVDAIDAFCTLRTGTLANGMRKSTKHQSTGGGAQ
jgi:hypothetical protein